MHNLNSLHFKRKIGTVFYYVGVLCFYFFYFFFNIKRILKG